MNQHDKHGHGHDKHNHGAAAHSAPWYTTVHRNWVFWVAVALMLVGMVVYVMSLDEGLQPDGAVQQPVPEAAD
jgi:hypothetical protein